MGGVMAGLDAAWAIGGWQRAKEGTNSSWEGSLVQEEPSFSQGEDLRQPDHSKSSSNAYGDSLLLPLSLFQEVPSLLPAFSPEGSCPLPHLSSNQDDSSRLPSSSERDHTLLPLPSFPQPQVGCARVACDDDCAESPLESACTVHDPLHCSVSLHEDDRASQQLAPPWALGAHSPLLAAAAASAAVAVAAVLMWRQRLHVPLLTGSTQWGPLALSLLWAPKPSPDSGSSRPEDDPPGGVLSSRIPLSVGSKGKPATFSRHWAVSPPGRGSGGHAEGYGGVGPPNWWTRTLLRLRSWRSRSTVTDLLVLANCAVFAADMLCQRRLTLWGAKVNTLILMRAQWWRLLTPVLLHSGIIHLAVNCTSLRNVGPPVEAILGPRRFLTLYAASGVAGCAASTFFAPAPAVGASGAIFGLMGALGVFFLRHRKTLAKRGAPNFLPVITRSIALNLLIGATSGDVDNWGHVGGLLGGAVVMLSYMLPSPSGARQGG